MSGWHNIEEHGVGLITFSLFQSNMDKKGRQQVKDHFSVQSGHGFHVLLGELQPWSPLRNPFEALFLWGDSMLVWGRIRFAILLSFQNFK